MAGTRIDGGSAFDAQFSPSLGVVFTTARDQSIRFTWKRGYLAPSAFQRFLRFPGGAPVDLSALEAGLRASPLGPALAGVPVGTLFTNSSSVPIWALGNPALEPEIVNSYETGYKAQAGRWFFTVDAYYSVIAQFNTDLLPGINSAYPAWTPPSPSPPPRRARSSPPCWAPSAPPSRGSATATPRSWSRSATPAARRSRAPSSRSRTRRPTPFASTPTTRTTRSTSTSRPSRRATRSGRTRRRIRRTSASRYGRPDGRRLRIGWRFEDAFRYRTGTWEGALPATHALDLNAAWPLRKALSISVAVSDLLDEQRIHMLGGSVIGRRALATLSWRP